MKATNSVGELVTKALEKNGLDAESEYGVTGLDFDGKTATVTGFAKENCVLIVAYYPLALCSFLYLKNCSKLQDAPYILQLDKLQEP